MTYFLQLCSVRAQVNLTFQGLSIFSPRRKKKYKTLRVFSFFGGGGKRDKKYSLRI